MSRLILKKNFVVNSNVNLSSKLNMNEKTKYHIIIKTFELEVISIIYIDQTYLYFLLSYKL